MLSGLLTLLVTGCPGQDSSGALREPADATSASEATVAKTLHTGPAKSNAVPVGISCALVPGGAILTLNAQADLQRVQVKAWGTRGLTITSGQAPAVEDWASGRSVTFSVQYSQPPVGASLAVSVEAVTNGQSRTRVVSFLCGAPSAPSKPSTTVDPTTGRALKVLPAK